MVSHRITQASPYTPAQLYALVMDVERYPEFIPWCRAARILMHYEQDPHEDYTHAFLAELVIAFKHIRESYVSRVTGDSDIHSVNVVMERGPFHHLTNYWCFIPQDQGCIIDFHIDFAFKNKVLETVIGALFNRATQKMVEAFTARASALYGDETLR
jgi:coenzyme Q-binding protein COQ10